MANGAKKIAIVSMFKIRFRHVLYLAGLSISAMTWACSGTVLKDYTPPQLLSSTCLYQHALASSINPVLRKFTPNYQLWSDKALKRRWIYLPENTQIDTADINRWVFPLGTQIFKEFRRTLHDGTEIKLETRHLLKIKREPGVSSWRFISYAWNRQQDKAALSPGAKNVLGTNHVIPTEENCIECHMGNKDPVLGFDAIQLSDKQAAMAFGYGPKRQPGELSLQLLLDNKRLSHAVPQAVLPGDAITQKALGYLHANCGNCHNPMGHAAERDAGHLKFRHDLAFKTVQETDVYRTAVNQRTQNFTEVPFIIMGADFEELALYQSAVFIRMNALDKDYRMPMLGRVTVDYQALDLIHRWMMTLETPDYDEDDDDE